MTRSVDEVEGVVLPVGGLVVEADGAREPGLGFVCRACDYYGVSADYLLCRTDRPNIAFSTAQAARAFLDQMQSVIDRANQTLAEFSEEEQPE